MNGAKTFAQLITEARSERGLSRTKFAGAIDMSPETVKSWEAGLTLPQDASLAQVCVRLQLDFEQVRRIVRREQFDRVWPRCEKRRRWRALASRPDKLKGLPASFNPSSAKVIDLDTERERRRYGLFEGE